MKTREKTDKRTSLRRRRNIKLNKRSIFCSLFLSRVELRHFATLFSLSGRLSRWPPPPSSSLLLPSSAVPARASTLFLPFGRFPLSHSPFPSPSSPPALFRFLASPPFSLSGGLCVETSRAEERHSIKVEYVRLGLFFTLGGVQIVKSILPPKFRMPPPPPPSAQRARAFSFLFPAPASRRLA